MCTLNFPLLLWSFQILRVDHQKTFYKFFLCYLRVSSFPEIAFSRDVRIIDWARKFHFFHSDKFQFSMKRLIQTYMSICSDLICQQILASVPSSLDARHSSLLLLVWKSSPSWATGLIKYNHLFNFNSLFDQNRRYFYKMLSSI